MVYKFLCKDENNTQKYLLTFALNIGVERSPPFFPYSVSSQKPRDYPPCYIKLKKYVTGP